MKVGALHVVIRGQHIRDGLINREINRSPSVQFGGQSLKYRCVMLNRRSEQKPPRGNAREEHQADRYA